MPEPPLTPGPGFLVSGENGCTCTSWVATALPTHNGNTRAQSCSTKVCVCGGGGKGAVGECPEV